MARPTRPSALIAEHPFITRQTRLTFARAGKTRPLSLEDYAATGGWSGLARARQIGPEQIVAEVLESGLRGRGGAGFPAGIKWQTVRAPGTQKYIVCNADEGDSGTFADRMVMEGDPFALIEGMAIAGQRWVRGRAISTSAANIPMRSASCNAALACAETSSRRSPAKCAWAPGPMSAARKPRCSTASKASAAKCAPSRRCRRWKAVRQARPWSTTC
jgi:hypothetical protein